MRVFGTRCGVSSPVSGSIALCRNAKSCSQEVCWPFSIGWMLMLISGRSIEVRIISKSPTSEPSCRKPPQVRITRSVLGTPSRNKRRRRSWGTSNDKVHVWEGSLSGIPASPTHAKHVPRLWRVVGLVPGTADWWNVDETPAGQPVRHRGEYGNMRTVQSVWKFPDSPFLSRL